MQINIKKIPREIIPNILSFLPYEIFDKVKTPFDIYIQYLALRNVNKSFHWKKSIFDNTQNKCFSCESYLQKSYFLIVCIKCELNLDGVSNYPKVCVKCVQYPQKIVHRKILCRTCPCCLDNRMHIAIHH